MPLDTSSIYNIGRGFRESADVASTIKNRYLKSLIEQQAEQRQQQELPSIINLRQAQASEIPSQINLRNAQAGAIPSEIDLRKAQVNESRFNTGATPLGTDLIRAKIEQLKMGGIHGGGVGQQAQRYYEKQIGLDNPDLTPDQIREAQDVYDRGDDTLGDGTKLNPMSSVTKRSLDRLHKSGTDVGQRSQERFAQTLESTFQEADKVAPGAFRFAGIAGKIEGGVEKLLAQVGKNDPDYLDYYIFTRQLLPAMAAEIIRTGGSNSTNTQKALAILQANPISWDGNPQMAMKQYEFLKGLYRSIGRTITQGPGSTHISLNTQGGNTTPNSGEKNIPTYNPKTGDFE